MWTELFLELLNVLFLALYDLFLLFDVVRKFHLFVCNRLELLRQRLLLSVGSFVTFSQNAVVAF